VIKKKAFSLIEIIFILGIISIILLVAVPKFQNTLQATQMNQLKTIITLIRQGIQTKSAKLTLLNNNAFLETLEENETELFSKVLNTPIISSNKKKINSWSKLSSNSYQVYFEESQSIVFRYDPILRTFDCDHNNPYCKELSQ